MFIDKIAKQTGVPAKTIRYYESIGLLPEPQRASNNYRQYTPAAIERLRFIVSARSLGFSIAEISEILAARDDGKLRCGGVIESIDRRLSEIDRRIADLLALRETLGRIRHDGAALPPDNACDEQCICYLVTASPDSVQITIQQEEK